MKKELNETKMLAVSMGNAAVYGSTSYDEKSARKKGEFWKKFIDSLTWDKLEGRAKNQTMDHWLKTLGAFAKVDQKKKKDEE